MRPRFLLALFSLFAIPLWTRANHKPKEYPIHGKVTAAGIHKQADMGAVLTLGLPG